MKNKKLSPEDFEKLESDYRKEEKHRNEKLSYRDKEEAIISELHYIAHHSNQFERPDQQFAAEITTFARDSFNRAKSISFDNGSVFSNDFECEFRTDRFFKYSAIHPGEESLLTFNSVTHYLLFQKTLLAKNYLLSEKVRVAKNQNELKLLASELILSDQDATTWNYYKAEIAWLGNKAKFSQNAFLRSQLMATEGALLMYADSDLFWGTGVFKEHVNDNPRSNGPGRNVLGSILTKLRVELMK